jgi:hypothetical protein
MHMLTFCLLLCYLDLILVSLICFYFKKFVAYNMFLSIFILSCEFIWLMLSSLSITSKCLKFSTFWNLCFFFFKFSNVLFYFSLNCFSFPLPSTLSILGLSVVQTFWQCFPFLQNVFLFLFYFFLINAMPSAYYNIFSCSLPIFLPLGTIFILCITFCNAKLNNIGDKGSHCFRPVNTIDSHNVCTH